MLICINLIYYVFLYKRYRLILMMKIHFQLFH